MVLADEKDIAIQVTFKSHVREINVKTNCDLDPLFPVGVSAVRKEQGGRLGATSANRGKVNSFVASFIRSQPFSTPQNSQEEDIQAFPAATRNSSIK